MSEVDGPGISQGQPHILHPTAGAPPVSLAQRLGETARRRGNAVAIVCGDRSMTWAELDGTSNQAARGLLAHGVGQDDFVTLALPNGVSFLQTAYAAWKVGATPQPVSAKLPDGELEHIVALARPAAVIAERDFAVIPKPVRFDLLIAGRDASALPDRIAAAWNAPTSGGSTGRPKLIVSGLPSIVSALPDAWKLVADDVALMPGPLYHNGPFGSVSAILQTGLKLVLMARFDAEELLALVERHRVTWLYLVPTMMLRIMRLPADVRARYDVTSLRVVWHVAAPCPPWLKQEWIDWLGADTIQEMYGGTDANVVTAISGAEWLTHRGSVGRVIGGGEIRIFDEAGRPLPSGDIGEVYSRRAQGVPPMFRHIGAEPRALPGGWETIGDMGYVDDEGYLYLADRRTDMILVGGSNVYPAEIESAIEEHPLVLTSAVIGLPDEDIGNRVHAIVQAKPDLTEEMLRAHIAARLLSYKIPRSFEWTEASLRDEAGKVRRGALRAERMGRPAGAATEVSATLPLPAAARQMPTPEEIARDRATIAPLFTPFTINGMTLKNRFAMAPMTRWRSSDGFPDAEVAAYYRRRAEHECALIISEGTNIGHPVSASSSRAPFFHGAALDGWRRVVDGVHHAGACFIPQLWHVGTMRSAGNDTPNPDLPSASPSGLSDEASYLPAEAMSHAQIRTVVDSYARAAVDARTIGCDGVEIHGAHGYLIDQFLWAETNRRDDEYGGDAVARTKLATEIIAGIRAAAGADFPVIFRLSQWKQQDYSVKLAHDPVALGAILTCLAEAGVDAFHCSQRRFWEPEFAGSSLSLAGWTRKLSGKPVISVGSVGLSVAMSVKAVGQEALVERNLDMLAARFQAKEFDMIAIGRSLLVDSAWIEKARDGRLDLVNPFDRSALETLS